MIIKQIDFKNKNIFSDAVAFLYRIKESYVGYSQSIMIGGLLGCKGNPYSGKKILGIEEAYIFHKQQTVQFQNEKINFLFAGIVPELNEAFGIAKAMAETNVHYIISFMLRKNGCLLDGTALSDAIKEIDKQVCLKPIGYMANCIHPTILVEALNNNMNKKCLILKRFSGTQANASILSCEELDNCNTLYQDDFINIIEEMCLLHQHYALKILGGCCEINDDFIEKLARKMISTV